MTQHDQLFTRVAVARNEGKDISRDPVDGAKVFFIDRIRLNTSNVRCSRTFT